MHTNISNVEPVSEIGTLPGSSPTVPLAWEQEGSEDGSASAAGFGASQTQVPERDNAAKLLEFQRMITWLLRFSAQAATLDEILRNALDLVCTIPGISREAKGCIFLVDEGLQQLTLVAHRGHAEVVAACRHLPFGTCLCGRAAQYGELVFADRIDGRHEIETAAVHDHGHYCVPIKEKDQLYGVLNLTLEAGYRRDLADEQHLECYANVLAMIIQRRRAEDALRTDRERLRLAVAATGLGFWDWNLETNGVFFSASWNRMLGCGHTETESDLQTWSSRLHADDRERILATLWDYVEGRAGGFGDEYRLRHEDGAFRSVLGRAILLENDDGKPCRVIGTDLDVSEIRAAEAAVRHHEAEMLAAREIQQSLLPQSAPRIEGLDIAGTMLPADLTGGDYFDYRRGPDGSLRVIVGDACGHGISAALLIAATAAHLRSLSRTPASIGETVGQCNQALIEGDATAKFVTLIVAEISPDHRTLNYVSAGHPSSYVFDRDGQVKARLDSTQTALRLVEDAEFPPGSPVALDEGDILLLTTDGVLEADSRDKGHDGFGTERLLEVVRRNCRGSAEELVQAVYKAVHAHLGGRRQQDDVTVVVVKVRAMG
jgi:PAS domain S-box-containing protein